MEYNWLPEGTRVRVSTTIQDFEGEITQCIYSAGIKGIGAGWKFYVKRDGESFSDMHGYYQYEITKLAAQ